MSFEDAIQILREFIARRGQDAILPGDKEGAIEAHEALDAVLMSVHPIRPRPQRALPPAQEDAP